MYIHVPLSLGYTYPSYNLIQRFPGSLYTCRLWLPAGQSLNPVRRLALSRASPPFLLCPHPSTETDRLIISLTGLAASLEPAASNPHASQITRAAVHPIIPRFGSTLAELLQRTRNDLAGRRETKLRVSGRLQGLHYSKHHA